jgi:Nuclear pore complex assembly
VECLTEPVLTPTFPEDILEALLKHAPRKSNLGLAYYHAVEPPISSVRVLDLLIDAMCRASLTEAFFASRTYDGSRRRHVFERVVAFVHHHEPGSARAEAGVELVGLPLDDSEEQWLEDYLFKGEGQSLPGSVDTMIMRQVAMGRTTEAERLAGFANTRKIDGLNWDILTQSLRS